MSVITEQLSIHLTSVKGSSFIKDLLDGALDYKSISNEEDYSSIYRIRHDAIHWIVCNYRSLPFGERHIYEIESLSVLSKHSKWDLIKNQSPDSIVVESKRVDILEITVSRSSDAELQKITKYSMLISVLKDCGFDVNLEVIVFSTLMHIPDRSNLHLNHKLPDDKIDQIYDIIRNVQKVLDQVHSTEVGRSFYHTFHKTNLNKETLTYTDEDVIKYHNINKNKCFKTEEELHSLLEMKSSGVLTDDDVTFLDNVTLMAMEIKTELDKQENSKFSTLIDYHKERSTTRELRPFMPLPSLKKCVQTDSAIRFTLSDETAIAGIKGDLKECTDELLQKVGQSEGNMFMLKLSTEYKHSIVIEGPERKKAIRVGNQEAKIAQREKSGFWFDITEPRFHNDIKNESLRLSTISNINNFSPETICDMDGPGLNYVRNCQSIFREISINAMRSNRRHQFIFKPTGVVGVFMLMYPGPKLRTGENVSTIWFKLIASTDVLEYNNDSDWMYHKWIRDGNVLHSRWLSTDANRLDHYLRCYDRILMSYLSCMHAVPKPLRSALEDDVSNTLGIIIMIYMEDKRSTSKMLQDCRYVVMSSLSIYKYWDSLKEKFVDPLRTPLQAHLLLKIIEFADSPIVRENQFTKTISFGKTGYSIDGGLSDKTSGAVIILPRLLTWGGDINFKQILCEMYFCMLFNKNQDDPTHASFQILDKMLEGENNKNIVKEKNGFHTGEEISVASDIDLNGDYSDTISPNMDHIKRIIFEPAMHQFSRKAITIGSKLQAIARANSAQSGLAHELCLSSPIVNKTLDHFATYKSSSCTDRLYYEDIKGGDYKHDPDDTEIITEYNRQNRRQRCIEGVMDLLRRGIHTSFGVIDEALSHDLCFQVFKKNQIGGVREILILPMDKRILINILESSSRVICSKDDREMLTHGNKKYLTLRDMNRELRQTKDRRIILNYNFDKSRWGPSFMPIQFMYMFLPFKDKYPNLFRLIMIILIQHTNKKCLLPEQLIRAWKKDKMADKKHYKRDKSGESLLQSVKDDFISNKSIHFDNESNMGQGILHYTSSLLHLCMISFRDEIYKRLCSMNGVDPSNWMELVSSDDSYMAQSMPMDNHRNILLRLKLMIRAQEVSERLFSMKTSKSKSSISFVVGEFNSLFGSNLTVYPTLFKFALSSVLPQNTDSYFRMVKEYYNSSRQIVENGGSLELYLCSQYLNKKYVEHIYHTGKGDYNDISKMGVNPTMIPYQLGSYPIDEPALMIMYGPEIWNYRMLFNMDNQTQLEKNIMLNAHTLTDLENLEVLSELNSFDNLFIGFKRIETVLGPIKRLHRIRSNAILKQDFINDYLERNPLLLFRAPRDSDEVAVKTCLKLYQFGSAEALRTTASCLYYARVAASVSASCFHIPGTELSSKVEDYKDYGKRKIGYTYLECLEHFKLPSSIDYDIKMFYPYYEELKTITNIDFKTPNYHVRNPFETQNLRQLQLTQQKTRLKNPLMNLLEYFWVNDPSDDLDVPPGYLRDWSNLSEMMPVIDRSFEATLSHFKGQRSNQIKSLSILLLRLLSYNQPPMKAVIYGPSCQSYVDTLSTLTCQNYYHNLTSDETEFISSSRYNPDIYDDIYFHYNHFMIKNWVLSDFKWSGTSSDKKLTRNELKEFEVKNNRQFSISNINKNLLKSFLMDDCVSLNTKRKIFFMMAIDGSIDDLEGWTRQTLLPIHQWIQPQIRRNDLWVGPFKLLIQMGDHIAQVEGNSHEEKGYVIFDRLSIKINKTINQSFVFELVCRAAELLQISLDEFTNTLSRGQHVIIGKRVMPYTGGDSGFLLRIDSAIEQNIRLNDLSFSFKEGYIAITNKLSNYEIFKLAYGLLPTSRIPEPGSYPDLFYEGVSFKKLIGIRFFSGSFEIEAIDYRILLGIIDDLNIRQKPIKKSTSDRLQLHRWPVRHDEDEYNYLAEETTEVRFSSEDGVILDSSDDIGVDLLNVASSEEWKEKYRSMINIDESELSGWVDKEFVDNLMSQQILTKRKYYTLVMWDRFLKAKSYIITQLCVGNYNINRNTIITIKNAYKNIDLVNSLITSYDMIYPDRDSRSIDGVTPKLHDSFLEKFNLIDPNDSIED